MTTVTSAGAGSGLDLESIISASVSAKSAQLKQPVTTKQTQTQITISGLSSLKSEITKFTDVLDTLSETGAFNKRSVKSDQDTDSPVFEVTTNDDASNGNYNVIVNKLATTSKYEGIFSSSTSSLVSEDGTLTFKAGDEEFTVDVKKGDTLQQIRKRINNNGDNFGLTANIINTSDGKAKLVFDSGVSGSGNNLTVTGSSSSLDSFTTANLTKTQDASDAQITVDGNTLTSDTNEFNDTLQGLDITVLRTSDKDTDGNLTSNTLNVTTDKSSIKGLVQNFLNSYNTLISSTTSLGKRNSIVGGESQNDGGALAGDSMTRSIQSLMTSMIADPSSETSTIQTIFQLGVTMDNDGVLSLDSDTFDTALDENYEQVVALFGGSTGLASKMSASLDKYTQTGGLIGIRSESLNTLLSSLTTKSADIDTRLTKYEENLRQQYGNLDTLLTKLSNSASSLTSLTSS